jgi:general secretion pathway protein C
VVLITESNDPDFSFAVIKTGSESKMRKIGDDVDGRKVEAIHAEHVVMAQGTTRCQLKMHENSPVGAAGKPSALRETSGEEKPSSISTKEMKSPVGQGIRKVSETEYVIEQNSADKLAQMERAFRSSGRTVDGSGLRLHRASQTTVLGQLGLMKGDVIKSINGHDMTSLDSSMTAYTQMKAAKNVQIVIERDGKPITMDYAVK